MILDSSLCLDGGNNGTFAAITSSRDSTNVVDVGLAGRIGNGRDIGVGTSIYLLLLSDRLFSGGTSVQMQFQGAPDNGSGAPGTYIVYSSSPALTVAQLNQAPGIILPITIPRPVFGALIPRFYKIYYNVSGTFTAGGVLAYLVLNRDDIVYYPSSINVANV